MAASLLALVACSSNAGSPKKGAARLSGRVVDKATGTPIARAVVAIENGGLDVPNPDPSKPNPSYQFGTITGADGSFSLTVSSTTLGVHAVASGYTAGAPPGGDLPFSGEKSVTIALDPLDSSAARPMLDAAAFDDAYVSTGAGVTLRVHASAPLSSTAPDPLSEATLVVEPTSGWAAELTPPAPGSAKTGFPDGEWSLAFIAPSAPGAYVYYVVATTERGVTSEVREVGLEVH